MTATNSIKSYHLKNIFKVPQVAALSEEQRFAMQVVGSVLPFKVNNYVVDQLIDWQNPEEDPVFQLTFPQRDMLTEAHFSEMADAIIQEKSRDEIKAIANRIRLTLNPHPAGQLEKNIPHLDGVPLPGIQHKYRETLLFFPSNGQTCHAYCTFCFRWPQFVGISDLKFATRETDMLVRYLNEHPEVTDVLITGGDPMIMSAKHLETYLLPLLNVPSVKTIRLGSKVLTYWPYRFLTDRDSEDLLRLFEMVVASGKHLSFMAHFNHVNELRTSAQVEAAERLRATGAVIRTQSPMMAHINDSAEAWRDMWKEQVSQGMIPYYMFLARDTGAQDYFSVPLVKAWEMYQSAVSQVSGVCKTVRGPSMSAGPGKIQVLGPAEIRGEKVLALQFIQGRDPSWVNRPFFAEYDPSAIWLDELRPAFGQEKFFFEQAHVHGKILV